MKALLIENRSGHPVMRSGEYPTPVPGEHELLVKVEATALNRADLLQKAGKYPPPKGASPILGLEMAGVVEASGKGVSRYQKGDQVMGLLPGGGYAEYCTLHEDQAIAIPESLSFEEAAAIPEAFLTAFQALIWLGQLEKKETVLIHAGASGVGTAAIQLASQLCHARVITTAGSTKKCSVCISLGADLAVNYKEENFAAVTEQTYGKQCVDVVIDPVGAPYWQQNIELLAVDGRLIVLSMLGGATVEKMSMVPLLRKRLSIQGSTLRNRSEAYKIDLTSDFATQASRLIAEQEITPVIDSIYDWNNVEEAHQRMEVNKNTGKIVLTGM